MMKFTNLTNAKRITELSYLGGISTSAKIMHSQEFSHQYTYAIYLAPAKTSGYILARIAHPNAVWVALILAVVRVLRNLAG